MPSLFELLATFFSLGYLYFMARLHPLGWVCALVSTGLYTWLFFDVNLWMESLLNLFYLVMAFYGFYQWTLNHHQIEQTIQSWPLSKHLKVCFILMGVVCVLGSMLHHFTTSTMTYLDSFTTCFSILATFMLIDKVIDNLLYWIVIDSFSIYMYVEKGLWLTSLLYCVYIAFALHNYFAWIKLKKVTYAN